METKVSDIIHSIGGVDFRAVRFGGSDHILAVVAVINEDKKWVISPIVQKLTYRIVEDYASDIYAKSLLGAAAEEASRYLPEMFAYVRNLPVGRRSNFVDSPDNELIGEAMADVKRALIVSIAQNDAFRASVEFEGRVPYLIADRGLIDVMDPIVADFKRRFDEEKWVSLICDDEEEILRKETPYLSAQIAAWRGENNNQASFR